MTTASRRPPRAAGQLLWAAVRAAVSATLTAAAVAGIPVLLTWATPVVWEGARGDLAHLLDRQDTGEVLVLMLLAAGWLAWLQFTTAVLIELPAQLRGRTARRRRLLGGSQRAAATLISSIVVLLPAGTAMAAPNSATVPTAELAPGPTDSPTGEPSSTATAGNADSSSQTARPSGNEPRTYTVRDTRPAESLWSIAETQLGDGQRWREIADLNDGRRMPDGSLFSANTFLQPGWVLLLPGTGHAPDNKDDGHRADDGERTVTVRTGDTLTAIADAELGNADRWPELFAANRNRPLPGGGTFTDPHLIIPGQQLTVPAADTTEKPGTPRPGDRAPDSGAREHTPGHNAPQPSPDDRGDHTSREEPGPSPTGTSDQAREDQGRGAQEEPQDRNRQEDREAAPPPARPSPTTPQNSAPGNHPTDRAGQENTGDQMDLARATGIAALLAAGLLATLGVKRILQRRRRTPGQTTATADGPSRLEQDLTAAAEPASVDLLDTALRTLAHHARTTGCPLPAVRGAKVTAHSIALLPEDAGADPLPPFTGRDGAWWTLPGRDGLLEGDQARREPAPYPGLVTVGTDPDGNLLLLHLPPIRALLVDGPHETAVAVIRAIALEAATCAWSDQADILTIGLGTELPALLPHGRFRAVPTVQAAARDLGELLLEHHQTTDADLPAPEPAPWLLLCAAEAGPDHAWQLADAIAAARDLPVAVVLPATDATRAYFPDAEVLHADPARQPQRCAVLDSPVTLQQVGEQAYRQIVTDLRTADQPPRPAAGPWRNVPGPQPGPATPPPPSAAADTPLPAPDKVHDDQEEEEAEAERGEPFPALAAAAGRGPSAIPLTPLPTGTATAAPAEEHTDAPGSGAAQPTGDKTGEADPDADSGNGQGPADAPDAPEIRVLGPLTVTGIHASGHGPKLAELAALIHARPGRGPEALCEAMSPAAPWSRSTLHARISELRNRLGTAEDGRSYLPRDRSRTYRLHPAVRCDWGTFRQLAERGLARGFPDGLDDLETALALVRGRPFGGAEPAWATAWVQEILTRITDVAHTVATWRRREPRLDLAAARRAVTVGLEADDTAELLYQDLMLIEDQAGNRAGVLKAIEHLQAVNRRLEVGMEPATEQLIDTLLHRTVPVPTGRR